MGTRGYDHNNMKENCGRFGTCAENIDEVLIPNGNPEARSVQDWMNSSGHKDNIMGKAYLKTGVGAYKNQGGTKWYMAEVFGRI